MYSWYDDTSDWAKPGAYVYDPTSKEARDAAVSTGMTDGMEFNYQTLDKMFAERQGG